MKLVRTSAQIEMPGVPRERNRSGSLDEMTPVVSFGRRWVGDFFALLRLLAIFVLGSAE